MKKLVSVRFEDSSDCENWINKRQIPREDVVGIQTRLFGCVARLYLEEDLYQKARKHNRILEKKEARSQIWMYAILGVLALVVIIGWLWEIL